MSQSAVEVVEALYARAGAGEVDRALELVHPDVRWEVPPGYPYRGAVGVDDLRRAFGDMAEIWADFKPLPQEVMDAGEGRVWVVSRQTGRGLRTGIPFDSLSADYWEVVDGLIVRHVVYADTKVLAEAVDGAPAA